MPSSIVPPQAELNQRLRNFREVMHERKLTAALIVDERNVRYLSGFTGNDSALLLTKHHKFILTDFRYIQEAKETAKGWRVVTEPHGIMEKAGEIARKKRVKILAIEPGAMRLTDMKPLRKAAGRMKFKREHGMVGELRLCKSAWEVERIEAALRIQETCFLEFCAGLHTGMTEREAAAKLRYMLVKAGADDQAFDIMFQIGENSSLPHGRPTHRALNGDAVILLDWGCKLAGYHSDLTRTFFLGKISPQLRQIHQIVLEAQQAVIERIKPGVELPDLDKAAHDVIDKAGFKKNFGHSTGHGIGLNIHEPPSLSVRAKGPLKEGMVVTVEPGIYLPNVGGVRLEDDVLVTKTGGRVLSRLKKGLRWDGSNE